MAETINYGSDIQHIKFLLEKIDEKQEGMESAINQIKDDIIHLKHTVVGNKNYKIKGLVDDMEEIRKYVTKDKMLKNKLLGGIAVIGFIWTLLLKYFTNWFNTNN
jgi:hypothetical protein